MSKKRPDWVTYFMNIAQVVSSRSNCITRQVGSIIISDKRIISTGYNGTPRGTRNCNEGGCKRCQERTEETAGAKLDECLCSHAEENAITQAAYHGISIKGSTLYTTFYPCLTCTKMIINSGIREVVFQSEYPVEESTIKLFREASVSLNMLPVGGPHE